MFQSARIKLTIWYVLISMLVSLFFSTAIFSILHNELNRNERRVEMRLQRIQDLNPDYTPDVQPHRQDVELTEKNIELNLLYINLAILAISLLAGYFLAGRTLKPIENAVEKQNQFIADASHELRTPLTALQTSIEVNLRDKKLDLKQAKTVLNENLEDANKLKSLSDNLLMLASLQTAASQIRERISLKEVILASVSKMAYLAKQKDIAVKTSLEDASVYGDKNRLTDLFVIFLDNSIKYSPKDTTITITSKIPDSFVEVMIKDQGIGIEKKDLTSIFERFYRADKSRSSTHVGGYGLGLAIAKEILNFHKGTVIVESEPKKGTTFIIKLPIKKL